MPSMDFRVDLIGPRERRALLLITGALLSVLVAGIAYLRPAASPTAPSRPAVANAPVAHSSAFVVLPAQAGTSSSADTYFVWRIDPRTGTSTSAVKNFVWRIDPPAPPNTGR